jgi:hypothetical protein
MLRVGNRRYQCGQIGILLNLGSFSKITDVARISGLLFVSILRTNVLGYIKK